MKMRDRKPGVDVRTGKQITQTQEELFGKRGAKHGYSYGPAADDLANAFVQRLIAGDMTALEDLAENPHLIRNVGSLLRAEGEYDLSKQVLAMLKSSVESDIRDLVREMIEK